MMKFAILFATTAATLATSAVPAAAQGRLDWRPGAFRLVGDGVPVLFPELRRTPRGRAFVMRNFDVNRDGRVSPREADAANAAFARRQDHAATGSTGTRPAASSWSRKRRSGPAVAWDRRAMHDYGFRQTPRGATLSLAEEVLFATDSAVLRPGAIDKLRALVRLSPRPTRRSRGDRRSHRQSRHRRAQPAAVRASRRSGSRRVGSARRDARAVQRRGLRRAPPGRDQRHRRRHAPEPPGRDHPARPPRR